MSHSKRQLEALEAVHAQEIEDLHDMLRWQEEGEPEDGRDELSKDLTIFEYESMLKHHLWSIYVLDNPTLFQRLFEHERNMMEFARRHGIEFMILFSKYATGNNSGHKINDIVF